jgi:hypothetical protein
VCDDVVVKSQDELFQWQEVPGLSNWTLRGKEVHDRHFRDLWGTYQLALARLKAKNKR